MKRTSLFLSITIIAAFLSGCIISAMPKDNPVVLLPGQAKAFTIHVFPFPLKYVWLIDGSVVTGATKNTYTYMLDEVLPSQHTIEARAVHLFFTDVYTWNVQYFGKNKPPTAEAGPDQSVYVGETVTLDGSGSTDPDNNIVSYHWVQTSGLPVILSDPNAINPQFTADVLWGSALTFELTVTDAGALTSTDTCVVNVTQNRPPVAEAGPNLNVFFGVTVTLNGSGSTDPDNNIVSYHWEQTGGPTVPLSDPNTVKPQFIADVPFGSSLTFKLSVTDAGSLSGEDNCVVNVPDIQIESYYPSSSLLRGVAVGQGGAFGDLVYVTNDTDGTVLRITGPGEAEVFAQGLIPGNYSDVAFDPSGDFGGDLFVCDPYNGFGAGDPIFRITSTGQTTLFYQSRSGWRDLLSSGIAFGKGTGFGNNMYVQDLEHDFLLRLYPDGTVVETGAGIGGFQIREDLVIFDDPLFGNYVYFTDQRHNWIGRMSPSGATNVFVSGYSGQALTIGNEPFGALLYLGTNAGAIYAFKPTGEPILITNQFTKAICSIDFQGNSMWVTVEGEGLYRISLSEM